MVTQSHSNNTNINNPYKNTNYYSPYPSTPFSLSNLSLNSVHLSPEELAAIDHGLMSVYGGKENHHPDKASSNIFKTPSRIFTNSNEGFIPNTNNNINNTGGQNTYNNTNVNTNSANTNNNFNNDYNTPYRNNGGVYFNPTTPNNQTPFNNYNTPVNNYNNLDMKSSNYNLNSNTNQNYNNNNQNSNNNPLYTNNSNFPQTPFTLPDQNEIKDLQLLIKQERDRFEQMEASYKRQLEALKKCDFGYTEKLKLEQIIQDLRRQIEILQDQLSQSSSSSSSSNSDKIDALKLHYDRKIANLVSQFEQEKASALEIMKTRAKAEINLIVPKLKAQLQANLERSQSQAIQKVKSQALAYIAKLKQDFQTERQVLIEHMRRKHHEEINSIRNQLQMKFETKLAEERDKMRRSSDTFGFTGNRRNYNQSSNYSLFGEEPSFLL